MTLRFKPTRSKRKPGTTGSARSVKTPELLPELPPLSMPIHGIYLLDIEGVGMTESIPAAGQSIAKVLGFAHAQMMQARNQSPCLTGNVEDAFELVSFDGKNRTFVARLKTDIKTMTLPAPADPHFSQGPSRREIHVEASARSPEPEPMYGGSSAYTW